LNINILLEKTVYKAIVDVYTNILLILIQLIKLYLFIDYKSINNILLKQIFAIKQSKIFAIIKV